MPEVDDYFNLIKASVASELAISPDGITTSTVLGDIGLDSLDVLNVTFRIEQKIARKIPVQKWFEEINEGTLVLERLTVLDLCHRLMAL